MPKKILLSNFSNFIGAAWLPKNTLSNHDLSIMIIMLMNHLPNNIVMKFSGHLDQSSITQMGVWSKKKISHWDKISSKITWLSFNHHVNGWGDSYDDHGNSRGNFLMTSAIILRHLMIPHHCPRAISFFDKCIFDDCTLSFMYIFMD